MQVAVRSEEPYRIHCYSILRSLAASDLTMGHDFLGAPKSQPVSVSVPMSSYLRTALEIQMHISERCPCSDC